MGHYCPEGTADPILCPVGTYLDDSSGTSLKSCLPCIPGSFSNQTGRTTNCESCPAGSYNTVLRGTMCEPCPVGGFCESVGAASASMTFKQCATGTYNSDVGASSNASCIACPPGKANPVPGSSSPNVCIGCLPGSIASGIGTGTCVLCEQGTYQADYGQTACVSCPRGSYCKEGSSTPVPCPGGTFNGEFGRWSVGQCLDVPVNFWAPLGSAEPEDCPPTGFYCPGRLGDSEMDPPGSKPII